MITKYDGTRLIQMSRESGWQVFTSSANRPLFFGDVLGDWREEVILAKQNDDYSQGFVVYSTSTPTSISMYTLLEDPHYAGDIHYARQLSESQHQFLSRLRHAGPTAAAAHAGFRCLSVRRVDAIAVRRAHHPV
jgi:hypothetical protein